MSTQISLPFLPSYRVTLHLFTGVPPNVIEFTQDISLSDLTIGLNTVVISQDIINQMRLLQLGTVFSIFIETLIRMV